MQITEPVSLLWKLLPIYRTNSSQRLEDEKKKLKIPTTLVRTPNKTRNTLEPLSESTDRKILTWWKRSRLAAGRWRQKNKLQTRIINSHLRLLWTTAVSRSPPPSSNFFFHRFTSRSGGLVKVRSLSSREGNLWLRPVSLNATPIFIIFCSFLNLGGGALVTWLADRIGMNRAAASLGKHTRCELHNGAPRTSRIKGSRKDDGIEKKKKTRKKKGGRGEERRGSRALGFDTRS